jgi:hypothetical protein
MHHHFTTRQVRNLQRGTRAVLLFGVVTSISANMLHSLTRPEAATASEPEWRLASAAALSALAPLVLFACTELVSRIPVHSRVLSTARLIVTFAVGGFAAWVSYRHMQSVAAYLLGETEGTQYVYPLIIDGMMIVATISLIELGRLARSVDQAAQAAATPQTVDGKAATRRAAPAAKGAQNRRPNQARQARPRRQPAAEPQPRTVEPEAPAPVRLAPAPTAR